MVQRHLCRDREIGVKGLNEREVCDFMSMDGWDKVDFLQLVLFVPCFGIVLRWP